MASKEYRVIHSALPWFDFPYKIQTRQPDNSWAFNRWSTEASTLTKRGAVRLVGKLRKKDALRGKVVWSEND